MSNINLTPRQVENYILDNIAPVYMRMVVFCSLGERIIMDSPIVDTRETHPYDVYAVIQQNGEIKIRMNPISIVGFAIKDDSIVELVRENASDVVILNRLRKTVRTYARLAIQKAIDIVHEADKKTKKRVGGVEKKEDVHLCWRDMEIGWLCYQQKAMGGDYGHVVFSPKSVKTGYETILKLRREALCK